MTMWVLTGVICLLASSAALPEEILVGGLFEKTNTLGKMVFIKALDMINEDPDLLPDSKLVPLAEEVPEFDSYQVGTTVCELMARGIAGVVGPTSSETSAHVQSLCDTMEIPHIETRWDGNQRRGSCLVNLYPHPTALTQAYYDIVKAWDWKRFTVIFDDYNALKKIELLLTMADDKGYLVTVRQLEETDNYRTVLRKIKHSGETNIVLECSTEKLYDVLTQAQQVGLMGSEYSYIITSLDLQTIDLEPFKWGGTNITGIRLVDPEDPDVKEVLRVWSSELEKANNENDFRKKRDNGFDDNYDDDSLLAIPFDGNAEVIPDMKLVTEVPTVEAALLHDAILLFATALNGLDKSLEVNTKSISCDSHTSWEHGYSIMNYMKTSKQKGMSGMIKFDHEGFRTDINLDIIELREEGLVKRGVWTFDQGVNISFPELNGERIDPGEDLRNTTFIVLIALTHPYGMLKLASEQLSGNDRFEGFGIDLIHELSLMSGFNYTFHVQADKSSGNPNNVTGKWNGMIGEVLSGRADLAIADITITREREKDADFTMPFMNLGISILYRKPTKAPPSLFSFLSPFSYEVWAYMMSAYLGVSLLLFVMARISPYEWRNPYPCIEEPEALENQFSLLNSLWFTMGSLMQQGSEIAPISVSTRMVAAIWWFFTLIMVSSYTANLAAFLTIESTVMAFKNVEELASQNVIKYGAKAGGSTANFFRDSNVTIYQKMGKFMQDNPDVMMASNEAGVDRVLSDPNYAFFMESTSIEYEVERKCDLTQVGGLLDNKGYGIVMRQNSSYRNILSTNVVKLQEKGKLTQLKDKWWKEKRGGGACQKESEGGAASELDLSNVGGVFVVLLGGCIFAVFLTIFEVLWDIYTRDDKTSFKEELMEEIRFIIQCHGTTKPVRKQKSPSSEDEEENKNEGKEEDRESSTYRRFRGNHLNNIFRDENKASLD